MDWREGKYTEHHRSGSVHFLHLFPFMKILDGKMLEHMGIYDIN
jgi:hypothetical protein